jgi:hypothetical protein
VESPFLQLRREEEEEEEEKEASAGCHKCLVPCITTSQKKL